MLMDAAELGARMAGVRLWFHTIALPHGVTTPGLGDAQYQREAAELYFGMGVQGRSVLDIGAWDGYFSFEAERRGASDVLAVDDFVWRPGGPGDRAAFDLAREALGSKVRDRVLDLPEVTQGHLGQFDIVLYNGIIYHVMDPVRDLINTAAIARHVLTIETWIDNLDIPRPVMNFFPGETPPPGAPQNGWGPNSLLMHALLGRIGFETVLEFPTPTLGHQRSIFLAFKPGHPFAEFVAKHAAQAQPRFRGNPALRDMAALAGTAASLQASVAALQAEVESLRAWKLAAGG